MTMTPRERFLATADFEPVDRPSRLEILGYWSETLNRWHCEGLPPDIIDVASAALHFEIDLQIPIPMGANPLSWVSP